MWRPIHKNSGKASNKLLTDEEKERWQKHPSTKGLYRFEKVEQPEPEIKRVIKEPIEAKRYNPEEPSSKKTKK